MPDTQTPPPESEWSWLQREDVSHLTPRWPAPASPDVTLQGGSAAARPHLLSIIVQAHREHVHLPHILDELLTSARSCSLPVELLIVQEDFFPDTKEYLEAIQSMVSLRFITRKEQRDTISGDDVLQAKGDTVVLFDADLHYGSHCIPAMVEALQQYDAVFAEPSWQSLSPIRAVQRVLGRILSSPLLLLRSRPMRAGVYALQWKTVQAVLRLPQYHPGRSFLSQMGLHGRSLGLKMTHVDTTLETELFSGWTHTAVASALLEARELSLLRQYLVTRFLLPFLYPPTRAQYESAGFTNVRDYLFLSEEESAKLHITKETVSLFIVCLLGSIGLLWVTHELLGLTMMRIVARLLAVLYFGLLLLKLLVIYRGRVIPYPRITKEDLDALGPESLPVVTVFIPLYKEREIIPQIFHRVSQFDYPLEKLDIIFILEAKDQPTIDAFLAAKPPPHFKALLSPVCFPQTKPKALNAALRKSHGDLIVIFDAEILPDVDQVKKAACLYLRYPNAQYFHGCMNVYNASYNWITRLYDAEFAFFYGYFLPGLVTMNVPIPLSGHSTYMRRSMIEAVGGWDPYNIAEDCDIGIRLFRHGFGGGMMLDSFSWEQSTTTLPTWLRQRTRWVQGFIQTSMVHLRFPFLLKDELGGWWQFLWFLILVPGNVILNSLNIFHWILLIWWFVFHPKFIEVWYQGFNLYIAAFCFIGGNFLVTYYHLLGLYSRKHFAGLKYALFSFVYWIMLGLATLRAMFYFFLSPHSWDKTAHFQSTAAIPQTSSTHAV